MFFFWLLACVERDPYVPREGYPWNFVKKILLSGNIYQHLKKGEATICIRSMAGPNVYERTFRCSLEHSSSWTLYLFTPNFLDDFPYTDDWWLPFFFERTRHLETTHGHMNPIIQTKLSPSQPNLTMPPFMPNLVVISYQIQLHTKAKHPKTMQQFSSQNFIPTQLHPIQWHPPAKLTWNLKLNPWKMGFLLRNIIFKVPC